MAQVTPLIRQAVKNLFIGEIFQVDDIGRTNHAILANIAQKFAFTLTTQPAPAGTAPER